jgi:hypothetical protein
VGAERAAITVEILIAEAEAAKRAALPLPGPREPDAAPPVIGALGHPPSGGSEKSKNFAAVRVMKDGIRILESRRRFLPRSVEAVFAYRLFCFWRWH